MKIKHLLTSTAIALSMAMPLATVHADTGKNTVKSEQANSKLNINTADAETIASSLKGIGMKKAQAIVAHRKQLGGRFKSLEQLLEVKGIGEKTLAKLKSKITL